MIARRMQYVSLGLGATFALFGELVAAGQMVACACGWRGVDYLLQAMPEED
jgi:hypothetical protein